MENKLLKKFRELIAQSFVPIFVADNFDTVTLLEGCKLAGVRVIEYTLRRADAHTVLPGLKKKYPEFTILVGSTIDSVSIVRQMRAKHPQLLSVDEVAPYVDGLVSMLPYSNETLEKYRATHLLIPTAETSGEALRQMSHGATAIKVCGPDLSFSKKLHAAPTFNYCPTFVTGGVNDTRMEEAYAAGNVLTAAGFDLILKGEDQMLLTPQRVAERLQLYLSAAKQARDRVNPALSATDTLTDEEFVRVFPHYCSVSEA
jgi:2-keto-3-deoxy-6-phosphogluconate aldolase